MASSQLLVKLDEIDWSKLKHAYGDASDVPGSIRSLLSNDEDIRHKAIYELFGNIWHQGTVYEASSYTTPFLQELLRIPETPDKMMIADLLAEMADGGPYLESAITDEQMELLLRESLAKEGRDFDQEIIDSRRYADATRDAVGKELSLLYPYLTCEEPEIRRSVATALGNYPDHVSETLPFLEDALRIESNEEVQQAIKNSIAVLKMFPFDE
jgi:hypothetical protein